MRSGLNCARAATKSVKRCHPVVTTQRVADAITGTNTGAATVHER
jgi:hypothetical protein